jgi:hypothetical protein
MAIIVTPPNESYTVESISENRKLFLAGGISHCADWQSIVIAHLSGFSRLTIYNPRRVDYGKEKEMEQICWEFKQLEKADIIAFWFAKETACPISLYELGKWGNSSTKPIVIGVDPEYTRKSDVIIQTSLARPDVDIWTDFGSFVRAVEGTVASRRK